MPALQFARIFGWYGQGRIRPMVSHSADLAYVAKALALLRNRPATGKVVLIMTED